MKKFDFNKSAEKYDEFYSTELGIKIDQIEKQCVSNIIDKIPKGNALEIGCGTGHWTNFFIDKGFSIVGIDIADKMLKIAQNKNLKNVSFKNVDILKSDFNDEVFDNVFAVTSLEFVENQARAFSEINRILKKDGFFMLAGFLKDSEFERQKKSSQTFKNAEFFSKKSIFTFLSNFGVPKIKTCLKMCKGFVGIVKKTVNFKS